MNYINTFLLNNNNIPEKIFDNPSCLGNREELSGSLTMQALLSTLQDRLYKLMELLTSIQKDNIKASSKGKETIFGDEGPEDPQVDPGFDPGIPTNPDGSIDYNALLAKLEQMLEYIKTHHMNLYAIEEYFNFLINIGNSWNQFSKDQQDMLKKMMGGITNVDGESLGQMIADMLVEEEFFKTDGTEDEREKAALEKLKQLLDQLQNLKNEHPDFFSNCGPLQNALQELQNLANGGLDQFCKSHWDNDFQCPVDDDGNKIDFAQWWISVEGKIGDFLDTTDLGNWNDAGKYLGKYFYQVQLQQLYEEYGNNPMLLVMMILYTIFGSQDNDRQTDIAGASEAGKYLSDIGQLISQLMELFKSGDFDKDKAEKFMQLLEEIKLRVDSDSDLPQFYKDDIDAKLDVFFNQKGADSGDYTLKDLWEIYKKCKDDPVARDGWLKMIAEILQSFQPDPDHNNIDIWTQMIESLSGAAQSCSDQSSIITTLINSMTNNENQFLAADKNLWDGLSKIVDPMVRNQRVS